MSADVKGKVEIDGTRQALEDLGLEFAAEALPDRALLDALVAGRSAADRVRGWLHVVRRCGWHRSWRLWPRWVRLARRGSPRYLVYAAACQTLFSALRPPSLGTDTAVADPIGGAVADLPVIGVSAHRGLRSWTDVVADIATLGWVRNLIGFYEAGELVGFDSYTAVKAWLERGLARPAVQRGLTIPARA